MTKIAITGATGQVGGELAAIILGKSIDCRLLARNPEKITLHVKPESKVQFDYNDPETYEKALDGIERIFLVCPPSVTESTLVLFIKACKNQDVGQIVFVSGMGADKNPDHFCSKFSEIMRRSEIPVVFLRANWFFQNLRSQNLEAITLQHELQYPDGQQSISFVDARDIAEVAAHFLTSEIEPGEIGLDITGPESISHTKVAELLSKHLPYQVRYKEISDKEAVEELGYGEVWMGLFRDVQNGLVSPVSDAVEKILGKPARDLESFIIENKSVWI